MRPEEPERVFRHVTLAGLEEVAKYMSRWLAIYKVWVVSGEMGAGKTTFIKTMGRALSVEDPMSSPSFSIVNEYRLANGEKFYHFDFYRIRSEAEAYDIGTDEYFYSGNFCFIEWPEKVRSLLPPLYGEVRISLESGMDRTIDLLFHGGKEEKRI
jgi:tRNA threonylcarbamoyladenosine biosynthesis protein TsaE